MENTTEIRLDISKVTHLKIKDYFKGVDTGWGVKQYKYCEEKYCVILWRKHLIHQAGFWRDGKQNESCLSPKYDKKAICENPKYVVDKGWVYTKASVEVFVGEKVIKELFFENLESAKRFCDTNFHNVNFVI